MMLATPNLLAFAWHAALDVLEPAWQAARQAAAERTSYVGHILMLPTYVVFPSWRGLLNCVTTSNIPPELVKSLDSS